MKAKDSRYNVWICEAKMSDGKWYPMPRWGSEDRRNSVMKKATAYFISNNIKWAMKKIPHGIKHSRRIRFVDYGHHLHPGNEVARALNVLRKAGYFDCGEDIPAITGELNAAGFHVRWDAKKGRFK